MLRRADSRRLLLWIFCAGVLGGTLFANLFSGKYINILSGMISEISGFLTGYAKGDSDYFFYLFKLRAIPTLMLYVFLFTACGAEAFCVVSAWYGLCVGAVVSGAILLWGMGGVLMFLAMVFPHYILYGLIFVLLLSKYERKRNAPTGQSFLVSEEISDLLFVSVFFLMGILLEAYLNPFILKMAFLLV